MWAALANCFEKLEKRQEAIKCTEWGERVKDKEAVALHQLAKLYLQSGEFEKAAECFVEDLHRREMENSGETLEALQFLSNHFFKQRKYDQALNYSQQLLQRCPIGPMREEAHRLINSI
jgi:anaphase-promoting complex subunit 8